MQTLKNHLKMAITVVLFLCAVVGVRNLVNPAGHNGVVMAMSAAPATSCCSSVPFPPALSATSCCSSVPFPPALHSLQASATSCCSSVPFPPAVRSVQESAATRCCSSVPFPPAIHVANGQASTRVTVATLENRNESWALRQSTRSLGNSSQAAGLGHVRVE